jgi:hypothetical protein
MKIIQLIYQLTLIQIKKWISILNRLASQNDMPLHLSKIEKVKTTYGDSYVLFS